VFYSHKHLIKLYSNISIINCINNFKSYLCSTGPGVRVILLLPRFNWGMEGAGMQCFETGVGLLLVCHTSSQFFFSVILQ
jgi:hypothetical protein